MRGGVRGGSTAVVEHVHRSSSACGTLCRDIAPGPPTLHSPHASGSKSSERSSSRGSGPPSGGSGTAVDGATAARLLKTVSSPPPERCDVEAGGTSTSVQPRGGAVTNRNSAITGRVPCHMWVVLSASLQLSPAVRACIDFTGGPGPIAYDLLHQSCALTGTR